MQGTNTIERIKKSSPKRSTYDEAFALGQVRRGLKRAVKDARSEARHRKLNPEV